MTKDVEAEALNPALLEDPFLFQDRGSKTVATSDAQAQAVVPSTFTPATIIPCLAEGASFTPMTWECPGGGQPGLQRGGGPIIVEPGQSQTSPHQQHSLTGSP